MVRRGEKVHLNNQHKLTLPRAALPLLAIIALACCQSDTGAAPQSISVACELGRAVRMAGLDWDSNAFHTEVAGFILRHGYGCEVEVIPGSTLPLLAGMIRGDLDVTMEIWRDNVTEVWQEGLRKQTVVELGTNFPDAIQGWFVPRYLVAGDAARGIEASAPDLRSVFDLPRYKHLFTDPEEPEKGRFLNCILGWSCEVVNTKKLSAYGLTEHFTNFRAGSGAALSAAIASAYKRGAPVLAYYWGPTWVLGSFDLLQLEEPPYDRTTWLAMTESDTPLAATAYPVVEVVVGVSVGFRDAAPNLVEFLTRYETTNARISEALAYLEEGQDRTPRDAAEHFLREHRATWTAWVPVDVGERVGRALAEP